MTLCVAAAGKTVALAINAFTLVWTHSVEKTEWREEWTVSSEGLAVTRASVSGTGAGMDIPADAVFEDGAWSYRPEMKPMAEAHFADAGRGADWRLCADGICRKVGAIVPVEGASMTLSACEERSADAVSLSRITE